MPFAHATDSPTIAWRRATGAEVLLPEILAEEEVVDADRGELPA
jgi:hypothetical protein